MRGFGLLRSLRENLMIMLSDQNICHCGKISEMENKNPPRFKECDHTRKRNCTRKRRESMMMIMMSHDAYTHQKIKKIKAVSSLDNWNDYPPHPIPLGFDKSNH